MSDSYSLSQPENGTVVFLQGVSVVYKIPTERIGTIKEYAIKKILKKINHHTFTALDHIDLSIQRGQVFGIIGKNGAGKSTLLKVISRVLYPTSGRVWINGKISPLLELGAGFHPELTGIENIFLNGTLLGHTRKEIQEMGNKIIEFSEIGEFINAPIRTYSSGMVARLGFSIATAWDPEILILDEVLSVGDVGFKQKCEVRMKEIIGNGATVLLVTHSPSSIETLCQNAILLDQGKIRNMGTGKEISQIYTNLLTTKG
jgi:ABC-2 type transport system ATP-binding protein/lipopolysaccharide transport system ATP-binding protein